MKSEAEESRTFHLLVCETCGRPNRIPASAAAANCGECKKPLPIPKLGNAEPDIRLVNSLIDHPPQTTAAGSRQFAIADEAADVPDEGRESIPKAPMRSLPHKSIRVQEIKTGNTAIGWVVAAIGGAIGISAFSTSPSAARFLVPCFIMTVYFLWGWQQDSQNKEKLADSLYFLGFIWTLYALIDALLRGAGQAKDANALFTTFGYALVTTGLGMFLRMAVIQLGYSAPEQLQDTRDAVAEGLEQFSMRLQEAQNALVISRNQFTTTADNWVRSSQEVSKALREASLQTSETARLSVERVVTGLQDVSSSVDACGESSKLASRAVSSLARRVVASGEKLEESLERTTTEAAAGLTDAAMRLSQVEVPKNVVATELNRLVEEMVAPSRALLASLDGIAASSVAAQEKVSASANTALRGIDGIGQSLERLAISLQAIEVSTDRFRASLAELGAGSSSLAKSTGQLVDIQTTLASRLNALQAQIRPVPIQPPRVEDEVSGTKRVWPWWR